MREHETSAPGLGDWEADLGALSKAATPGPWHVDMFPYFDMESGEPQPPQCEGICTHDEAAGLADSIATCGEREAAFIVALVNAYREGRMARAADAEHYMHLAMERAEIIRSHPTAMAEAVASARAEGVKEGLERAAKIADDWLKVWGAQKPTYVSAQTWANGAVGDIAEVIREQIHAPPTLIPGGSSDV